MAVTDRWLDPDYSDFTVHGHDEGEYFLCHATSAGQWEITRFPVAWQGDVLTFFASWGVYLRFSGDEFLEALR